jgi:F0F1-type ATP synthase assembly protein I
MTEKARTPIRDSNPPGEASPAALAGLGVQFLAAILFFVYAGTWLDDRLSTAPLFLLSGVLVGGGGVFYASYRRLMRAGTATMPAPPDHDDTPKA